MISARRRFFWMVATFTAIAIAASTWGRGPFRSSCAVYMPTAYKVECNSNGNSGTYVEYERRKKKRKRSCGESYRTDREPEQVYIRKNENVHRELKKRSRVSYSEEARNVGDVVGNIRRDLLIQDIDVSDIAPIRMKFHIDENGQVISYDFVSRVSPKVKRTIKNHVYDFYFTPADEYGNTQFYKAYMDLHI